MKNCLSCNLLLLTVLAIAGCGVSKEGRQKIAALKVACEGTYDEFRAAELDAKGYFEANPSSLGSQAKTFAKTIGVAAAVDHFWLEVSEYQGSTVPPSGTPMAKTLYLPRIEIIDPEAAKRLRLKTGYNDEERSRDPDFFTRNYVIRGLRLIKQNCEQILK